MRQFIVKNSMIELYTQRLLIRTSSRQDAVRLSEYAEENKDHLKMSSPMKDESIQAWKNRIDYFIKNQQSGTGYYFLLFLSESQKSVIGNINFTDIRRGPVQSCNLGYALDQQMQGQGLMIEALRKMIPWAFHTIRLHRIQANYLPTNESSGALLRKMGFQVEGYARDYLFFDGQWRDHILTSLVNRDFTF